MECGECHSFVVRTEQLFGPSLQRYGFQPLECAWEHGGRECVVMYGSATARLLFSRSDGSEDCLIGGPDAPFHPYLIHGTGEYGWYHLVRLVEFQSRQRWLTERRLRRFLDGSADFYGWQAALLDEWAEPILALVAPPLPRPWEGDFQRMIARTMRAQSPLERFTEWLGQQFNRG